MTRKQLVKRIRHLSWDRGKYRFLLRSSKGDCPILAAYRLLHPQMRLRNSDWRRAATDMGLTLNTALQVVREADQLGGKRTCLDKELGLK